MTSIQKGLALIVGVVVIVGIVVLFNTGKPQPAQGPGPMPEPTPKQTLGSATPQTFTASTPTKPAELKGTFFFDTKSGLHFFVPVLDGGEVTHAYALTFTNQDEAIKQLGINTSQLKGKDPGCSITSKTQAVITVSGYDATQAEAVWGKGGTSLVTLVSVGTPAESGVVCATP